MSTSLRPSDPPTLEELKLRAERTIAETRQATGEAEQTADESQQMADETRQIGNA